MKTNPPAPQDTEALENLATFGIVPGKDFDPSQLNPAAASALALGSKLALARIFVHAARLVQDQDTSWGMGRRGRWGQS
jgi:hypothetical protein